MPRSKMLDLCQAVIVGFALLPPSSEAGACCFFLFAIYAMLQCLVYVIKPVQKLQFVSLSKENRSIS